MMGERRVDQSALFYEFSLERHVPADHMLRAIDRFVELDGLRAHLAPFYSAIGRPSIDPELLIRMLLVGYCFGIRSERRLCEEVHLNLNALQLREIGRKTKRGLQGVASAGRHTGGRVYGYSRDPRLDDRGELIRGLLAINPIEAEIVRRILKAYAAGQSPRSIASDLNAESIPAPGGSYWNASTINGNARRGNGILHNELYRGVLVFGRQTWVKDRRTGRRHARDGDPSEIIRTPVPHLRIVSDRLWRRVRKAHTALAREAEEGSHRTVRPKHLLSGLMRCGACGGPLIRSGSGVRFICSWRRERGVCANGRSVPGLLVEAAYAEGLERLPANKARETLRVHLANLRASDGGGRPPLEALRLVRELTASVVVTPLEERGRFAFDVRWLDETALPTL